MTSSIKLFTTLAANGSSGTVTGLGNRIVAVVDGTWNGASVILYVSPDSGTTWVAAATALTASGVASAVVPSGFIARLTLSSAGGSTSLNAWVAYADV